VLSVVIHGRSVTTERLFGCPLFCGFCADVQPHDVLRSTEQSHIYFVDVGPADQTELTRCTVCGHVAGCNAARLDPNGEREAHDGPRRSDLDAFIRAHHSLSFDLRWSAKRVGVASVLVVGAAALTAIVSSGLGIGGAGVGLFVGLGPAVLFAYHDITRADFDREVARQLRPKVERLLRRTGVPIRAFAPRARQLGLPRLARFFASPAFLALGPHPTTPYR
jgi:hypothetical protein